MFRGFRIRGVFEVFLDKLILEVGEFGWEESVCVDSFFVCSFFVFFFYNCRKFWRIFCLFRLSWKSIERKVLENRISRLGR